MRLARPVVYLLASVLMSGIARAEVKTREVAYRQGAVALRGFLAYDDSSEARRPGVIVVHEWWGLNQYARDQAVRLARAGYVAFAADMYGKGKVAKHPDDARAFMQEATQDPGTLAARFDAALAVLKGQKQVDPSRVGVVGYCFGGGVALRMARAGKDLDAVATFHGAMPPPAPIEKGAVKARILIQTGGADPAVPVAKVEEFARELRAAGASVEVVVYPGARHSFTVPDADKAGMEALRYDPKAASESWTKLIDFFDKVLKTRTASPPR
jgi:dienelactone hydrolase